MSKILKFVLALLFMNLVQGTMANPVDMNTAHEVGVKFLNANTNMQLRGADDLRWVTTYSISRGEAAFHVFNTSHGFVIVAADDCASPILGYSDEGQFDVDNIPIQLQDYLKDFVEQIHYGIENHLEADEATARQWELVIATGHLSEQRATTVVAPLLTDIWDQDCYYNDKCPEDPYGPCEHVLVGCVATSFSQILHYWGYPINGAGSHTYTPAGYPQQTANFGATTYDWANMPNELSYFSTSTQIDAVATLMWHCGVAVDMMYGPHESGAFATSVAMGLVNYFGYSDELSVIFREDYSDAGWLTMIKYNLNLSRPVYYSGYDEEDLGGHAFVCDGYDVNDHLHFNWGWGGSCNGYFPIGALNPSIYAYNVSNMAIVDICPKCNLGSYFQVSATPNLSEGGTVEGAGFFYCGASCTLTATPNEGYVFDYWTKDGEVVACLSTYNLCVTESANYVANFHQVDGIAIGDANATNVCLPTYYYSYISLSQQIYTADELNTGVCEISNVSFFNTSYSRTRDFTVYMVNTDKTAFESDTDWINFTEADQVFSGSVTMNEKDWTTIYFNTPFNYNGSSNVALIVEDKTNSWNGRISCRTFDTDENQSIYIFSSAINSGPFNLNSCSGTLVSEKNQVVFGIPRYEFLVTVSTNPEEGGTLNEGVGLYYYGQSAHLTVTTNAGYVFNNWTKNDAMVSCFSTDVVTVTESAEYVANFQQTDDVAIGEAVSTNSILPTDSYNKHSMTQQIYTASELGNEACQFSSVSFFNTKNAKTRNLTVYLVNTDKMTFENSTDWITVTETDQVFSGNFTLASRGWTTIFFTTPFAYDGSSNLALIIDDNTNQSSYDRISCRSFSTEESQAICISGSGTDFDPCNPSNYEGTLLLEKNQVVFGIPNYVFTVTATAVPEEGGAVSGGEGLYYQGQTCTLTATANEGYCFYYWTENGTVVSTNATYTFSVMENMNLVANFGLPINIIATTNPEGGGTVSGGGSYDYNQTCTLTATSNDGYVFISWTKNDTVVSYLSTYSFPVVAEAEYIANFQQVNGIAIGDATFTRSILPTYSYYSYSMSQQIYTADELGGEACVISSVSFFNTELALYRDLTIYMVNTNKVSFENTTDWITVTEADQVFSGTVFMVSKGWTTISFPTPFSYDGISNVALIVDDNTGSGYRTMSCRAFGTNVSQAICVTGSGTNYDPSNPTVYEGSLLSIKNHVIFGYPNYNYWLSLTANPAEGGTVSGGGMCYYGQSVPINATANEGYVFDYWSKNGYSYSCLSSCNVSINGNTECVANFQQVDGIVIGQATHGNSSLPFGSYYSLSQQIYTAEELNAGACEITNVSFFLLDNDAPRNMSVYLVNTDKTSFESETDWIAVTEADKVFSGTVIVNEYSWTTIYFATPFLYDGFSNVALIIDDNTGWSLGELRSRTFDTDGNQTIRVTGTGTNYDPYNPTNYEGVLLLEKNQVIFGTSSEAYEYTLSVEAYPEEGGTVSGGGGLYYYGQSVPVSATANAGYTFNCWLKNDELVSYSSADNVIVTEDSECVAIFQQVDGVVVGEASQINYFLPTSDYYSYSLSQQIYTAEELNLSACDISNLAFFSTGYYNFRELSIYMVLTDKVSFESDTDWIAVTDEDLVFDGEVFFIGGSWSTIYFAAPFAYDGSSNLVIVVNDRTGNGLELGGAWEWSLSFRTFDCESTQAIHSNGYDNIFDPCNPSNYSGTLRSEKNQIMLGIADFEYTVNVSANPEVGGTVSGGGGMYYFGQPIPVTATANEGYVFNKWTNYGSSVSYYSSDVISVYDNMNLVANFQQFDGIIVGDASSSTYYLPTSEYPNSLTQQIYTVNELGTKACEISSLSFFNMGYSGTRDLTIYMVPTNKVFFEHETDWITVSEADQVFDGTVFMDEGDWITVYFNTTFAYSGMSNVALVVHDKTNDWGGLAYYRTFDAFSTQAIHYEDYEPIDPYNPFGNGVGFISNMYYGTLMSEKNQVVFGTPTYEYTIRLSANPEEGGTVSGGEGLYFYGQPVTVSATANEGYVFNTWTKFNEVLSCLSTDNIPVTESAEYVANFQQVIDDIVIGEATRASSYLPIYSDYSCSLSQQIYTADELNHGACAINSISFFNTGSSDMCGVTVYLVHTDKMSFESNTDWIAFTEADQVFSGIVAMEGKGWTTLYFDTMFAYDGISNIALVVNKTSYWGLDISCRTFDSDGLQTIYGQSYDYIFDPSDIPNYNITRVAEKNQIILGVVPSEEQSRQLSQGWNWWSTYIELSNVDGLTMLENSLGESGLTIKSQNAFVEYNVPTGTWTGGLNTIDNESGYKIKVSEDCSSVTSGAIAVPENHPITLVQGWNWIGYPVTAAQTVATALSNFEPTDGDIIKGQNAYATYSAGMGWTPANYTLIPGECYMYYSGTTVTQTLVFSQGKGEAMPEPTGCHWKTNCHAYPDNLSVMAIVEVEGEEQRGEQLELGAFIDGECRGSVKLYYVEPLDRYIAFLTVTGKDGEEVGFRLLDESNGTTGTSADRIFFSSNAVIGSFDVPFSVRFSGKPKLAQSVSMRLYPNPVNCNVPFTLEIPEGETAVELVIMDVMGQVTVHDTGRIETVRVQGLPVSGVYTVRVKCRSGNTYMGKMVVK